MLGYECRRGRGNEPHLVAKEGPQIHPESRAGSLAYRRKGAEALLSDRSP
jgi:hypothetical protein